MDILGRMGSYVASKVNVNAVCNNRGYIGRMGSYVASKVNVNACLDDTAAKTEHCLFAVVRYPGGSSWCEPCWILD